MPNLFFNYYSKHLAIGLILVMTANLIIGGVLLPYRAAQAIPVVVVGDPYGLYLISQTWYEIAWEAIKTAWEKVVAFATNAGVWITAAVKLWEKADTWYMRALKYAFTILKKKLLDMLVDDIVKWIQGGGKPRIVTDWKGFLGNAADQAGGQFVDKYLGLGLLCGKFALQLRFVLVAPRTFDTAVRCTLSDMGKNIGNFFNDFTQGGWKNWIDVTETQGNIYGTYLTLLDQKIGLEAQAAQSAQNEGVSSSGFLGDKVCIKRQCPNRATNQSGPVENYPGTGGWKQDELDQGEGNFCECLQWETRTPGKILGDAASKAMGKDIDWLISSKEFSEYIGAILDAVINRTVKEGMLALKTSGGSSGQSGPGISTTATAAGAGVNLSAYDDATQNGNSAAALVEQENLLKENQGKYLTEQQTTLGVLNQIKDTQDGSLTILKDMLSSGCSLPAGVTFTHTETAGNCAIACPCAITATDTITTVGTKAIIQKITTQQKGELRTTTDLDGNMTSTCVSPSPPAASACHNSCVYSSSAATYQISTSTPASTSAPTVETEIFSITIAIAATQSQLSKIDTAITDMGNYQKAASDYVNAYEALQRGTDDQATASSTEALMWTAKSKAATSTQAVLNTAETDLNKLLQKVQQLSLDAVQKTGDLQTKRGFSNDCAFTQDGTYAKDLCNAQAKQTEYQNAYTTCLQQQQGGGGG